MFMPNTLYYNPNGYQCNTQNDKNKGYQIMLHYDLEKKKNQPLYETLYEVLKQDILKGRLRPGERLPSKREMARDNGVSVKTVLAAYEQLLVEGYLTSRNTIRSRFLTRSCTRRRDGLRILPRTIRSMRNSPFPCGAR